MAAGGARYFVRMPEEFRECISPDILKELPAKLDEPRTYLSVAQARICARTPELKCIEIFLPGWVRSRWIAQVLGYRQAGINLALEQHTPWVWATEFENVHSLWIFREPKLSIDGIEYRDSEAYYQNHKPPAIDRGHIADEKRLTVMKKALRAKFEASKEASDLLKATYPHPLLAIKPDKFWGFHHNDGGSNFLAILLMEIRQEIVENPLRRKENAKQECEIVRAQALRRARHSSWPSWHYAGSARPDGQVVRLLRSSGTSLHPGVWTTRCRWRKWLNLCMARHQRAESVPTGRRQRHRQGDRCQSLRLRRPRQGSGHLHPCCGPSIR